MTSDDMKKYLSLYGADLERWPEPLRQEAVVAFAASDELRELFEKEQDFEALLNQRGIEAPSPDLVQRIIAKARPRESVQTANSWSELLASWLMPKAVVSILVIFAVGLAVGTYVPRAAEDSEDFQITDFLYYEEDSSWDQK